ncbi:hypothetical protein GCM10010124_37710 [Pilimelia terevasa]|uniref:Transposase IS30-like HTH domain-containing protein n=1 Tax=Pilimelia terevasa TaxID=53372 RepID=A0A8J3BQI4_9ACTN|nr:hypothetical protein GCM10010124_37710 [Pilimelia terevasa]
MRVMLTLVDREEISRGLAEGLELKQIAKVIGRDPSVVSREVARHGGRQSYRAAAADEEARAGRRRPKLLAVDRSLRLRAVVSDLLRRGWSPASIAGRLPVDCPDDHACRVSHEAIYQWVYAQPVSTPGPGVDQLADRACRPPWGSTPGSGPADQRAPLHRPTPRRG